MRLIDAEKYKKEIFRIFPCSDKDDRNIRRATELAIGDAPTVLTIPDNPTNGDMIKTLFPNAEIFRDAEFTTVTFPKNEENTFDNEWWEAPYKGTEHESNHD